jgi:hypothetical protein
LIDVAVTTLVVVATVTYALCYHFIVPVKEHHADVHFDYG